MAIYTVFAPGTLRVGSLVFYGLMLALIGICDWLFSQKLPEGGARTWSLIMGIANIVVGILLIFGVGRGAGVTFLIPLGIMLHFLARIVGVSHIAHISGDGQKTLTQWMQWLALGCAIIALFTTGAAPYWIAAALALTGIDSIVLSGTAIAQEIDDSAHVTV